MTVRSPESIDQEAVALRLRLRELRAEKRLAILRAEREEAERPTALSRTEAEGAAGQNGGASSE